jgi:hypothetical protein
MAMRHIYTSESGQEPGLDLLFFVRKAEGSATDPSDLLAVGIQCKYSGDEASTTLSAKTIRIARRAFRGTMVKQGWAENQLIFVLLARHKLSGIQTLVGNVGPGQIVVLGQDAISTWLGPSLMETMQNMHNSCVSHGPHQRWADIRAEYEAESKRKRRVPRG